MTYSHTLLVHPGSLCGSAHWHEAITDVQLSAMSQDVLRISTEGCVHLEGQFEDEIPAYPDVLGMVNHCGVRVPAGKTLLNDANAAIRLADIGDADRVYVAGAWGEVGGCARFVADYVRHRTGAIVDLSPHVPVLHDSPEYRLSSLQKSSARNLARLVRKTACSKLVDAFGFGTFDGGCFLLAAASRSLIGGGQFVLLHDQAGPQHFVLRIGEDSFLDGFGMSNREQLTQRLRTKERLHVTQWEDVAPEHAPKLAGLLGIPYSPEEVDVCVHALRETAHSFA